MEGGEGSLVAAVHEGRWRGSRTHPATARALHAMAHKMSAEPTRMVEEDWQPLRALGFDDAALLGGWSHRGPLQLPDPPGRWVRPPARSRKRRKRNVTETKTDRSCGGQQTSARRPNSKPAPKSATACASLGTSPSKSTTASSSAPTSTAPSTTTPSPSSSTTASSAKASPIKRASRCSGTRWSPSTPRSWKARPTSTKTGKSPTPNAGCPTATPASASIHAVQAAPPASCSTPPPANCKTSTNASNGPEPSPGPAAKSACSASPTTAATNGAPPPCTRPTSPPSFPGKAQTTPTATPTTTAASSANSRKLSARSPSLHGAVRPR